MNVASIARPVRNDGRNHELCSEEKRCDAETFEVIQRVANPNWAPSGNHCTSSLIGVFIYWNDDDDDDIKVKIKIIIDQVQCSTKTFNS